MIKEIHFKNKEAFRKWLEKNHDKSEGIWMLYFKKHTKSPGIEYSEALDEALCFGWIDSIIKRIDKDRYVRKFTPRKNTKNWSEVNKVKVMKLIQEERMTLFGLQKIDSYAKTGQIHWEEKEDVIDYGDFKNTPTFILTFLKDHPPALEQFKNLAPSYRKEFTQWIINAKRDETRSKRLHKLIENLKQRIKPGMV